MMQQKKKEAISFFFDFYIQTPYLKIFPKNPLAD